MKNSYKATNTASGDPFDRPTFHILCSYYSELDERWTDLPQKIRAQVNRLYLIRHGTAAVFIDGKEVKLEQGYLYLIPANCMLNLKAEQAFGKYWCHFFAPTHNGFDLLELISTPIRIQPADPEQTEQIFQKLIASSSAESSGWINLQRISWLLQLLNPFLTAAKNTQIDDEKQQFKPALEHIQSNLDQNITVDDLAHTMGCSNSHFAHSFTKTFQCSPMQFIIQKRIFLAERMLCLTARSVKEIGQRCGFNSQAQFSKIFTKVAGRTPLKFRKVSKSNTPPSNIIVSTRKEFTALTKKWCMKSAWLKGNYDWLYCNIYFRVLSTVLFRKLDLGWNKKEERTDCNVILYIISGTCTVKTDGIPGTFEKGELHLVPKGSSLEMTSGYNLTIHSCCFSASQEDGSDLFKLIKAPARIVPESRSKILGIFNDMEQTYKGSGNDSHRTVERIALLLELLIPFLQAAEEQPRDQLLFTPVLLFIRNNIHRPISLEELATTMSQSPEHFSRSFREALKITPLQYLLKERINRAQELLTGSNLTVQRIGEQCGFNTPSHFAKTFKQITGLTPGKFRKQENQHPNPTNAQP